MLTARTDRKGNKMDGLLNRFAGTFDSIHMQWEREGIRKRVCFCLVVIFILALIIIEINRQGWLPGPFDLKIPVSHYMAINLAFSLVLILEVISLIFTLPGSMSKALGKQFEILALILLRNSFKELVHLPEPIDISGHYEVLWHILAYGGGAVMIFALLGVYLRVQKNLDEVLAPGPSLDRFIMAKKTVAFLLLLVFVGLGICDIWLLAAGEEQFDFFHYFYTILVFSDILLVLIAQSFLPQFPAVFRNSGYALATLLIRLSLTAPVYYNVMIGFFSILFALVLTLVYNWFYTLKKDG